MTRILFILVLLAVCVFSFIFYNQNKNKVVNPVAIFTPNSVVDEKVVANTTRYLFVPYWSLSKGKISQENIDEFIYFGVGVTENGINTEESGYKNLPTFLTLTKGKKTHLTLRMLDSKTNFKILENPTLQKKVINEVVSLAKKDKFTGIVLDLEVSSLPFASVVKNISEFSALFYKTAKSNNLEFAQTVYGDVFYRIRPYDVSELAKNSDRILVMAYDFYKAGGSDPGPNFPLGGKEKFGYDLKTMTSDFLNIVPKEKLSIVFGLYGYDWKVDEKNKSLGVAQAMSFLDIENKFLKNCSSCSVKRDANSAETSILYTDSEGQNHIVWFEDKESVLQKTEYLKSQGIHSVSYWANSYF